MRTSTSRDRERTSGLPAHPDRSALLVSIVVGTAIGLGLGFFSVAGTLGIVIGGLLGAIAGGVVGKLTIARNHRQSAKDRAFDREIGTIP